MFNSTISMQRMIYYQTHQQACEPRAGSTPVRESSPKEDIILIRTSGLWDFVYFAYKQPCSLPSKSIDL